MVENEPKKIKDYISNLEINSTPEEKDAVQPFSKKLVEVYGYPKDCIQTRPQYHVKARPSDTKNEYPVDIAVFKSSKKIESQLWIIVECKQKNRTDGVTQLQNYLTLSNARLGVWYNGKEILFFLKIVKKNGEIIFENIHDIPNFNQRIEEIGLHKKQALKSTDDIESIFESIYTHLSATSMGSIRDEVLAQQLIHLIFCKIHDEKYTKKAEMVRFRAGLNEDPNEIKKRILDLFEEVKNDSQNGIDLKDQITLDGKSIVFIVEKLTGVSLKKTNSSVLINAFETFIRYALSGGLGQYITPRHIVKMIIDILHPTEKDRIIDPACGSGGFLIESLKQVYSQIEKEYKDNEWDESDLIAHKNKIVFQNFRGIDKDHFFSQFAKAYMTLVSKASIEIYCEDSLDQPRNWKPDTKIELGTFDIVVANPPLESAIQVNEKEKLEQFELAYQWGKNSTNFFEKSEIKKNESAYVLFIERCFQLLKNGGRMAIFLPDIILGNNTNGYIRNWIVQRAKIIAVIDLPAETFSIYTKTKTSILIVQKLERYQIPQDYQIFLANAKYCGNDRQGRPIERDDISAIAPKFEEWKTKNNIEF